MQLNLTAVQEGRGCGAENLVLPGQQPRDARSQGLLELCRLGCRGRSASAGDASVYGCLIPYLICINKCIYIYIYIETCLYINVCMHSYGASAGRQRVDSGR